MLQVTNITTKDVASTAIFKIIMDTNADTDANMSTAENTIDAEGRRPELNVMISTVPTKCRKTGKEDRNQSPGRDQDQEEEEAQEGDPRQAAGGINIPVHKKNTIR